MLRLFFYPSFQLAFRTGTFGAYAFMTLTLGVLWLGHLVLHDVFLSVFQCGMTLLIAYGAIGHLYFRKALQDAFVERQVEISQGVLLRRDSKVERDWFRRPHMRLTALFGENLNTIRVQTQSTVSGLVASSESIESDANKLATRAEEIAAMLEQTASGMEEFAATIERSAASCHSANKQTNEIQRLAEQSAQGVSVLVQKMQTSKEFTDRVQKVLASIDEIAVQINILALNASIEAARAGEQGRAFAVVATEVRKLAVRTSESTKKVNSALNVAAEITEAGVWLANDATAGMNEIKVVTEGYGKLIANIAMSANEQSAGVAQIKMAVEQMALLTQTNVSSVDELKSIASAMRSDADQFKNGVEKIANIDVVIQK